MKRILALDLGRRKVGVAISDPLMIFAQGIDVLHIRGKSDLLAKLSKYFHIYEIEKVVLGNPLDKKGKPSLRTEEIKKLAQLLSSHYDVETVLWDERFTTKEAEVALRISNIKDINRHIDKVSAQLILQAYLEKIRNERLS